MGIPTAPPSGFRDFLPEACALRSRTAEAIERVYRSFGFQRIATSAVENLEVLLGKGGGTENEKLIFKILKRGDKYQEAFQRLTSLILQSTSKEADKSRTKLSLEQWIQRDDAALDWDLLVQLRNSLSHGEQPAVRARLSDYLSKFVVSQSDVSDLGLRFDLTLPLARFYAANQGQLPNPFKAFQMGPVWRAERAQKGRYREFMQCDVDIIGSESWAAEADVITAILAVFHTLGISDVEVLLNDRVFVRDALSLAGVPDEKKGAACIIIDKLDKVDRTKVLLELEETVGGAAVGKLHQTLLSDSLSGDMKLPKLEQIVKAVSGTPGLGGIRIAPSLMRGLDYYTGPVFEFRHAKLSGSLGGGGRYDRLTESFGAKNVPACGASIGFERLMLLLEESGGAGEPGARYCVTVFSEDLRSKSLDLASALRGAGHSVDVYPGEGKLKAQLKYADAKKADFALILGPDEAEKGEVTERAMKTGDERRVKISELGRAVRSPGT